MKKPNEPLPQNANDDLLVDMFPPVEDKSANIIKVIGVGGGGSNAVANMFNEHPTGVRFAVCNTDSQALSHCPVPVRVLLGTEGLGVGGVPEKGQEAAERSLEATQGFFDETTRMVFVTAGMGGGTGTGAAPVIARQARERGILTIGIVTLPFAFERRKRINKALKGLIRLHETVDALLVINNERLLQIYADGCTTAIEAFKCADDILSRATLSIAEIITVEGIINRDFCDVQSTMRDGGSAIISVGHGTGEGRIFRAMHDALNSPLLTGVRIEDAKRLLCIVYTGEESPVCINEFNDLQDFMEGLSPDVEFIFGLYPDPVLGDEVKVSIVASGFDDDFPADVDGLYEKYYGAVLTSSTASVSAVASPAPTAASAPAAPTAPAETPSSPANTPTAPAEMPSAPSAPSTPSVPGYPTWTDRLAHYITRIFEED